MFAQGEEPGPTQHEKILVAQGNNTWDSETLRDHVRELEALAREGDAARITAKLREVVSEYRPREGGGAGERGRGGAEEEGGGGAEERRGISREAEGDSQWMRERVVFLPAPLVP